MSSQDNIVMDDIVILGNAVPDEISDNRFTVCTAGFSPTHGFLRIYPVPTKAPMNRWNVVKIPLEKKFQRIQEKRAGRYKARNMDGTTYTERYRYSVNSEEMSRLHSCNHFTQDLA
jgi:hypothetical protein